MDLISLLKFLRCRPSTTEPSVPHFVASLVRKFGKESASQRLRQFFSCIMLRRSLTTIELPPREDRICYLTFTPAEAQSYQMLKTQMQDVRSSEERSTDGYKVLQMFSTLRMVCNLGVLRKRTNDPLDEDFDSCWDDSTAQRLFDDHVASGDAACKECHLDTLMSDVIDLSSRPWIFPCGWLVCGACNPSDVRCACPSSTSTHHKARQVSLLSTSQHADLDITMPEAQLPTKVRAVLSDLEANVMHEKWYDSLTLESWTAC